MKNIVKPSILSITTKDELLNWYWSKQELISLAKQIPLPYSGSKFEIQDRIAHYLDTGEVTQSTKIKTKPKSKFSWQNENLTLKTVITDNYKNTQNVRIFFRENFDKNFSFNIDIMHWMKENIGKTLQDAIDFLRFRKEMIKSGYSQTIPDHNQFNLYIKDYFKYKPNGSRQEVNKIWNIKINLPGNNTIRFNKRDLDLI